MTKILSEHEFWQEIDASMRDAEIQLEPYGPKEDTTFAYNINNVENVGFFIVDATVTGVTASGIKYEITFPVADTTHTTPNELENVDQTLQDLEAQYDEFNSVVLPDGLTIDNDDVDMLDPDSKNVMTGKAWSRMRQQATDLIPYNTGVFDDFDWSEAILNNDKADHDMVFEEMEEGFNARPAIKFLLKHGNRAQKTGCLQKVIRYSYENVINEAFRAYDEDVDDNSEGAALVRACRENGYDFQELTKGLL